MRRHEEATESRAPALLGRRETLWLTGAGLSLIAVCYCLAIVLSTMMTPRFGGRAVAIAAGLIATAGVLMIAAAPNALGLAIGVLIAGSSTGVASPPLAHAVAHTVRQSVRDRTQTVINAGTGVGVAIAGPVALLTHEHWRAAWLVFAILCAIVTIWVAVVVPSGPADRSGPRSAAALLPRPLLPTGSGKLIAAAALMGVASSAVWTFGRDVLVTVGGMSETASTFTPDGRRRCSSWESRPRCSPPSQFSPGSQRQPSEPPTSR